MRRTVLALMLVMVSVLLLSGCKEKVKPGSAEVKREQVSGVSVRTVGTTRVDEYYETSGTVAARTVSTVASKMMGTVTSLKVKEGDKVRTGQMLLTIDDSDVLQKVEGAREGHKEALKALEAAGEQKKLADVTYDRYRKLYDDKALTGQEFDQIETQRKVAEIGLEQARAAVGRAEAGVKEAEAYHGFTRITSPVGGFVTGKNIELGSMAVPGAPLITVEDNSSYRIEINADERLAGKIRPGMEASVFIEALNRAITGKVTEVVPSVDPASRSFMVKIGLNDEGLRNGFYGKVSLPVGKKDVLLLPASSVVEKGELTGVYAVDKASIVSYRLVRVGKRYDDNVEILSGVVPGERVVVEGMEHAVDGGVLAGLK